MSGSDASTGVRVSRRPTIAVVGPGAIGTTVAAALHEAGRTPRLYGRTPRAHLDLEAADARIRVPGLVHTVLDPRPAPVDIVFVAVKATQVEGAARWLNALCHAGTAVCVLQNGVEQVEMFAPLLPAGSEIVPAVVWFPAQAHPGGAVRLRGDARISLPRSAAAARIADVLRGTRCVVEIDDDYLSSAWRKLLQNATAGLMALTGRRSGMFAREDIADLARSYLREGLAVARAEGGSTRRGGPGGDPRRFPHGARRHGHVDPCRSRGGSTAGVERPQRGDLATRPSPRAAHPDRRRARGAARCDERRSRVTSQKRS